MAVLTLINPGLVDRKGGSAGLVVDWDPPILVHLQMTPRGFLVENIPATKHLFMHPALVVQSTPPLKEPAFGGAGRIKHSGKISSRLRRVDHLSEPLASEFDKTEGIFSLCPRRRVDLSAKLAKNRSLLDCAD